MPTGHNAVLAGRYRVLLAAMDPAMQRVFDIGCGDGTLTFELRAAKRARVGHGRFASAASPGAGRIRPQADHTLPTARAGRCPRLPFPEAFDCVVMADVIEHIDAPRMVIEEAYACSAAAGRFS